MGSNKVNYRTVIKDKRSKQRLPSKPVTRNDEWLPALRMARTIPFGYSEDPDDRLVLLPIIEELEHLEMAKKLLKEYSSRDVAQWLTEKSGRSISHAGLLKRVSQESTRNAAAGQARRYEKLYKEAKATAERIEAKIGGKATKPSRHLA